MPVEVVKAFPPCSVREDERDVGHVRYKFGHVPRRCDCEVIFRFRRLKVLERAYRCSAVVIVGPAARVVLRRTSFVEKVRRGLCLIIVLCRECDGCIRANHQLFQRSVSDGEVRIRRRD